MSHFVMLITGDYRAKLAPYDENTQNKKYTDKDIFCKAGEYETYIKNQILPFLGIDGIQDENFRKYVLREKSLAEKSLKSPRRMKKFILHHEGGEIDREGNIFDRTNPNAKWDWYMEGGRWCDFYRDKNDNVLIHALKKEFDFDATKKADKEKSKDLYKYYKKRCPKNYGHILGMKKKQPTLEEYLKTKESVRPYGFLDTEWHDYEEENYQELFDNWWQNLDPDTKITVIDCHI